MHREFLKLLFSVLLFGSSGIIASQIHMGSYEIVFLRTGIGSLLLAILFFSRKRNCSFGKNKRDSLLLLLSGMCLGGGWIFLHEAYQQIGVSISTLVYYTAPVVVMMLSPFFFQEKLNGKKVSGFLVVLCGMLLINGQTAQAEGSLLGMFCAVMSAGMYVLMLISNKKAESIKGMENAVWQLLFSFLTVAVYLFLQQGAKINIPTEDRIPVLLLGLINTGLGCYCYFSSIGHLPIQTVAVCSYLEPLSAVVLSAVLLGESMTALQILGAGMLLGGAFFSEIAGNR